jgi:thiamine-phosphate diphosphorylase
MVVLDQATARLPLPDIARAAVAGGADLVQVREKSLDRGHLREVAKQVIESVGNSLLVSINADATLAGELGTHLHLPEHADFDRESLPLDPSAIVGRSIHSANGPGASDLDYLLLGNLFETSSKPGKAGLGAAVFSEIASQLSLPVLAIGGIRPETVAIAFKAGAFGVAVSSFVNSSDDPERAARQIGEQIDRWKS